MWGISFVEPTSVTMQPGLRESAIWRKVSSKLHIGVARMTKSASLTLAFISSKTSSTTFNRRDFARVLGRWEKPAVFTPDSARDTAKPTEPPNKPSPITVIFLKCCIIKTLRKTDTLSDAAKTYNKPGEMSIFFFNFGRVNANMVVRSINTA